MIKTATRIAEFVLWAETLAPRPAGPCGARHIQNFNTRSTEIRKINVKVAHKE